MPVEILKKQTKVSDRLGTANPNARFLSKSTGGGGDGNDAAGAGAIEEVHRNQFSTKASQVRLTIIAGQ